MWPRVALERHAVPSNHCVRPAPVKKGRKQRRKKHLPWKWLKEHKVEVQEPFIGFQDLSPTDKINFIGFDGLDINSAVVESVQANDTIADATKGLDKAVCCISLTATETMTSMPHVMNIFPFKNGKKIRVLCLFDGIAVGLQALKELGFDIEIYFSSEINEDALAVQRLNFLGEIVSLGCVTKLHGPLLHSLGQIDLLMGGSPCNDFSRVNPRRRLFSPSSSGRLFYEFVRIRDFLQQRAACEKIPLLWMFENTTNLDHSTKLELSRCLGCKPAKFKSQVFLPVRRERFFWSNFLEVINDTPVNNVAPMKLHELLKSYRQPNVEFLPTLTTSSHSELCGPAKVKPVKENGVPTQLSATEREVLLGLPRHFTDAESLSTTQRKKLLGRAWCCATVKHVLSGLCKMYAMKG